VWWFISIIPATQEVQGGGLHSEARPRQKTWDLIQKITKIKKGWGCGSSGKVASECKALSSNTSTTKKKERI
jgi:hypothetical protein